MTKRPLTTPLLGGSLEVVSSLVKGLGGKTHHHDLASLTTQIEKARQVFFFLIDGLGYDMLATLPKNSFLVKECRGRVESVFPSATTAAITTLLTGLSPLEHGVTGWFTYFTEMGEMAAVLPSKTRAGKALKLPTKIVPRSFVDQMPVRKELIIKKNLAKSPFNSLLVKWDDTLTFQNMGGMFRALRASVSKSASNNADDTKRTFTYMYWGGYDDICHLYGKQSEKAHRMLKELDARLGEFAKMTESEGTLLIVTADHGQMTTTRKKTILLNRDAYFTACLRMPCGGEPRALFCYVQPERRQFFEKYVQQKYRAVLKLYRTEELIGKFGSGTQHPRFLERTGDYVLIPKENYVLRFFMQGQDEVYYPGHHGALSDEERMVPLIVKNM